MQELHFGFDDRFYNEEAKPWYRCEICQKCHCGTSVKIKRAQHGLLTGTDYMVKLVTKLIEDRRKLIEGEDIGQKINNLRDIRVLGKKNKITIKNLYHETFLLRILEMLDFFSSLSLTSPASFALIQKFIEPRHLQYLIKLLVSGLPRMKIIAVKIFQSLLSRQIPHEILHKAVRKSEQYDAKIRAILDMETNCDLSAAPFFKFIFNLLMDNKQQMWQDNAAEIRGSHAFAQELARLFSSVLICQDGGFTKKAIYFALENLHSLSEVEIETVFSILP